jgi:glucose-1-phosphatase
MVSHDFDNIIFDLGGVILNLNFELTNMALAKLAGKDRFDIQTQNEHLHIFQNLETGALSPKEFRDSLKSALNITATDKEIDDAWNAMLLDIPTERVDLLKRLGAQKRIFMLSNTNAIHKDSFYETLSRTSSKLCFSDLFERVYLSHEMGTRKPNANIYQQVLEENRLDPSRTLFIDDSLENIDAAKALGIMSHHLTPNETILDLEFLG